MHSDDDWEQAPPGHRYSDSVDKRHSAYRRRLAELGLSVADGALFGAVRYGWQLPPDEFPRVAAHDAYNPGSLAVTEADCRSALAKCLRKGWLQILDPAARVRIAAELQAAGMLGPIYGRIPQTEFVDFTCVGAELAESLFSRPRNRPRTAWDSFAYADFVRDNYSRFFPSLNAALAAIQRIKQEEGVVAISEPAPIGPWRTFWWQQFPRGYRVDVEERRHWKGLAAEHGERCDFDGCMMQNVDRARLHDVLNRRNVTPAEWMILASCGMSCYRNSSLGNCESLLYGTVQFFHLSVTAEECRAALHSCLQHSWVRVVDDAVRQEMREILADASVITALPQIEDECIHGRADFRFQSDGSENFMPFQERCKSTDAIDFTRTGALLYRTICADWLGPTWEDLLVVSCGTAWEEHHYSDRENPPNFELIQQERLAEGYVVKAARLVPIGPWCVHWWERFPSGYRYEIELESGFQ